MKKIPAILKNSAITGLILLPSFCISILLRDMFVIQEHVTTVFVFAVFLVSLMTEGYVYGIFAAVVGVLAVNYAFAFPYFSLNFTIPENFFSALVMTIIALMTSALTTKVKRQEAIKAEGEKERMRANLLRAVSHDLRTPLTTIYGSSSALLDEGHSLTPEQTRKMLQGIREDAQWLVRMVENLLSITRIDAGRVKILKTPTVLEELIDSVVLKFNKRYPDQSVELDIPEDLVLIPMDAILMEQVLINLLENGVQHARGMTRLSLRVFTLAGQAIFEISDNGCGIRPDRLERIFTSLYDDREQPADSHKRNAGIGLSVCATIIRAHGGEIRAENARDGGAIFRFSLSLEDSHE